MNSLGESLVPSAIGLWRFGNVAARRHNQGAARGGCGWIDHDQIRAEYASHNVAAFWLAAHRSIGP